MASGSCIRTAPASAGVGPADEEGGAVYSWSPDGSRLAIVAGSRLLVASSAGHARRIAGPPAQLGVVHGATLVARRHAAHLSGAHRARPHPALEPSRRRLRPATPDVRRGQRRRRAGRRPARPPRGSPARAQRARARPAAARHGEADRPPCRWTARSVAYIADSTETDCEHVSVWTPSRARILRVSYRLPAPCEDDYGGDVIGLRARARRLDGRLVDQPRLRQQRLRRRRPLRHACRTRTRSRSTSTTARTTATSSCGRSTPSVAGGSSQSSTMCASPSPTAACGAATVRTSMRSRSTEPASPVRGTGEEAHRRRPLPGRRAGGARHEALAGGAARRPRSDPRPGRARSRSTTRAPASSASSDPLLLGTVVDGACGLRGPPSCSGSRRRLVLRLDDGRSVTFTPCLGPVLAAIGDAGLYYSYRTPDREGRARSRWCRGKQLEQRLATGTLRMSRPAPRSTQSFATAPGASALAAGDLDGDGRVDLVSATPRSRARSPRLRGSAFDHPPRLPHRRAPTRFRLPSRTSTATATSTSR